MTEAQLHQWWESWLHSAYALLNTEDWDALIQHDAQLHQVLKYNRPKQRQDRIKMHGDYQQLLKKITLEQAHRAKQLAEHYEGRTASKAYALCEENR